MDIQVRVSKLFVLELVILTYLHLQQDFQMDIDPPEPREPTPPPPPPPATRSGRRRRLPKRLDDFLPSSLTPVPAASELSTPAMREVQERQEHARRAAEAAAAAAAQALVAPEPEIDPAPTRPPPIITEPNSMGLYREYPDMPFQDPDDCWRPSSSSHKSRVQCATSRRTRFPTWARSSTTVGDRICVRMMSRDKPWYRRREDGYSRGVSA